MLFRSRLARTGAVWHFWGRHVDRLRRVDGDWLLSERVLVGVDSDPVRADVPADLFLGHRHVDDLRAGTGASRGPS